MGRINVTKTFLPPRKEYDAYVDRIWESSQLTNQGPLLREFEEKVSSYLDVTNFQFVSNGTLALQVALRSLDIDGGEVITTPFSYVAPTSAILWENFQPVFVDIDQETLCIDPDKIQAAITEKTKAILAVHVFGNICDVEKIEKIAKENNLKVIYDGAHAFGTRYKDKSVLSYGDISMCSFHSTKLFHTIEGGGLVINDPQVSIEADLIKRFGHLGDNHIRLGINAKASEFQAAMGLANLPYIDGIINERKAICGYYDQALDFTNIRKQSLRHGLEYNFAYYPIVFESEDRLERVTNLLESKDIYPRRYFYPSLNTLPYLRVHQDCPVSEGVSKRILCLPLYSTLSKKVVNQIAELVNAEK